MSANQNSAVSPTKLEFQTSRAGLRTLEARTTVRLQYVRFSHRTPTPPPPRSVTLRDVTKFTRRKDKQRRIEVAVDIPTTIAAMFSTPITDSVLTSHLPIKTRPNPTTATTTTFKAYTLAPLLLIVCLIAVLVFVGVKRKHASISRHRRNADDKLKSYNSLSMGHGPSDEVMYALVKMSQSPLASVHSTDEPLPPTPTATPSSAEHYSTVCDAVDLATPIYDEPPTLLLPASPPPRNPASSSASSTDGSCDGDCCDLYYQPIDAAEGASASTRRQTHVRRHQYDSVYIPTECEHGMQRRVDAGGYVKCRRPPRVDPLPPPPPHHHHHHAKTDHALQRCESRESRAYERLDFTNARPVLPLRRESLAVTTPTTTPTTDATDYKEVPPLPPRQRPGDHSRDSVNSNVYERVDLTHGCPMMRPVSVECREQTPRRDTDPLLATTLDQCIPVDDQQSYHPPMERR